MTQPNLVEQVQQITRSLTQWEDDLVDFAGYSREYIDRLVGRLYDAEDELLYGPVPAPDRYRQIEELVSEAEAFLDEGLLAIEAERQRYEEPPRPWTGRPPSWGYPDRWEDV